MSKKPTQKQTEEFLNDFKKRPADKEYSKRRIKLKCCDKKRPHNDRSKYGASKCDSYSLNYRLPIIISNNLFQYIADAKPRIVRDDWDIIEKHAQAIQDFAEADGWDKMTTVGDGEKDALERMIDYDAKERAFREAMFWLTENLQGLWW